VTNNHRTFLMGSSPVFLRALKLIEKLGSLDVPVLIEGETGTGKELAARAIHYGGTRQAYPFVPVNCGSFAEALIESELFGHVKGAFTDARMDKPGLVTAAEGGTLFLDEVDSLSARAQVALLRFLQDWSYRPVGGQVEFRADVRVIAATNNSLEHLAQRGEFRTDLLYRLKVLNLMLPPLRDRGDDVFALARHFFESYRLRYGSTAESLDERDCGWFCQYEWPGNVRELENLIIRESLLCETSILRPPPPNSFSEKREERFEMFLRNLSNMHFSKAKAKVVAHFEQDYLTALMTRANGNVSHAARLAGKERRALGKLLKKHGVEPGRFQH
jgi:DNA-binding NtrC family response regulator